MKTSLLFSVLFVLLILAITPAQSLAGSYSFSGNDLAGSHARMGQNVCSCPPSGYGKGAPFRGIHFGRM